MGLCSFMHGHFLSVPICRTMLHLVLPTRLDFSGWFSVWLPPGFGACSYGYPLVFAHFGVWKVMFNNQGVAYKFLCCIVSGKVYTV